jgi:hypothetical protein
VYTVIAVGHSLPAAERMLTECEVFIIIIIIIVVFTLPAQASQWATREKYCRLC